jgi:hypothetical protein
MPKRIHAQKKPIVLGGSLTRSPDGVLQTLQTNGIYPSPQTVQHVWSNISRRRYPRRWEGEPLESVGHVIQWRPREIACGHCGHSLGRYVAYRVVNLGASSSGGERGIVEQTSRHYEPQAELARRQAARRGPKSRPRFYLQSQSTRTADKTTACFSCPDCGHKYTRNLARLGERLFTEESDSVFLFE